MKLGSLFDGAGGFPFAAQICGMEPVWASEIEPFPIAVTRKRLPNMKHLGDVSRIRGGEIEPVDVVTFGSPCQDLSVAGRRAGLDGERSGLFMQAIRIIKEMREKTNGAYPRIAIWENVPGAFSSNKGEDFRTVLEAFCRVKDGNANVPRPPKGKWADAGEIVGDGYSVAWRVLDAQYWGVPQRRRRIFLVADFRGGCAGKILFERGGLSRNFAESRESWQGITEPVAFRAGSEERKTYCLQGNGIDRADTAGCNGRGWCKDVSYTLNTIDRHGVAVFDARGNGDGNIVPTITGDHENRVTDYTAICVALDRAAYNQGQNAQYEMGVDAEGKAFTVIAMGPGAVCYAVPCDIILRRLTPTECARLQGMPDWWVDGIECPSPTEEDMRFWREVFGTLASVTGRKPETDKQIRKWLESPHSDSAEYKMWGNGMALPCVLYVLEGVKDILKEENND